jgi:hypothetical protein
VRFLRTEERSGTDRIRNLEERMQRDANPARRWEYHVLRIGPKARAEHQLNELGSKGWQLVQAIETDGHIAFYMEREVFGDADAGDDADPGEPDETTSSEDVFDRFDES